MSVSSLPPVFLQLPFMQKGSTYRINVYTFNKTLTFADRIKRIDVRINVYLSKCASVVSVWNQWFWFSYQALEYLPFEGTVSLKNPQHVFCLLEDYGSDPNNIPEHPDYIYFGRWVSYNSLFWLSYDNYSSFIQPLVWYMLLHQIADGQRELIRSHSVKNRHFIGNTSMDAGLSLIMSNHAKVKKNDFVFDPFVGTGENLLFYFHTHVHLIFGECVSNYFHIFGSLCFRESVNSMLAVWCLRLWSRYRLQHYSWQRLVGFNGKFIWINFFKSFVSLSFR